MKKKTSNTARAKAPQSNKKNSQIGNIIKGLNKRKLKMKKMRIQVIEEEKKEKGKAKQKNEAKDKNFEKRESKTLKDNKNTKGNPPYIKKNSENICPETKNSQNINQKGKIVKEIENNKKSNLVIITIKIWEALKVKEVNLAKNN